MVNNDYCFIKSLIKDCRNLIDFNMRLKDFLKKDSCCCSWSFDRRGDSTFVYSIIYNSGALINVTLNYSIEKVVSISLFEVCLCD